MSMDKSSERVSETLPSHQSEVPVDLQEALRQAKEVDKPLFFFGFTGFMEGAPAVETARENDIDAEHLHGGMMGLYTKLVGRLHTHTPTFQRMPVAELTQNELFQKMLETELEQELKRLDLEKKLVFIYDQPNSLVPDLFKKTLTKSGISFSQIQGVPHMRNREMVKRNGKQEKRSQVWSEAYVKAQEKGQRVLFVCAQGQERSVAAQREAAKRGEVDTDFLSGGYLGIEDEVIDPIRTATTVEMGFLGRTVFADEKEKLNAEIDRRSRIALKEWLIKKGWKNKYIRVFNDEGEADQEKSPVVKWLLDVMNELGIEYETVTSPQMSVENARLGSSLEDEGLGGNWLRNVVNE